MDEFPSQPSSPPPSDEPVPAPVPTADPAPVPTAEPASVPVADPVVADDAPVSEPPAPERKGPSFGIGTILRHPTFGTGRVQSYDGNSYVILFKSGEAKLVSFDFAGMEVQERDGDPEMDRIREAMREVLSDYGWLDSSIELGPRWQGGSVILEPGKSGTQAKEIPMDVFFKKIIGVREKLRVLEQKVNNHKSLSEEEKMELDGYITRCYGSLTTFNVLFADKVSAFHGTGKKEE